MVSYDIPDDRRRGRMAKELKNFGARVQYSVFECRLDGKQLERMLGRISAIVKEEEDSVRVYPLCASCIKEVKVEGRGMVTEDKDVYIL